MRRQLISTNADLEHPLSRHFTLTRSERLRKTTILDVRGNSDMSHSYQWVCGLSKATDFGSKGKHTLRRRPRALGNDGL